MGKRLMALLGVVCVVQASCKSKQNRQQDPVAGQQAGQQQEMAPTLSGSIDSVDDTTFGAYIRKLSFVPDPESGDRQGLLLGHYPERARFGPVATIQPEVNSDKGSVAELRLRGKVIARIQVESIGAQPYPKLGLLPGTTTYWWVQLNAGDTTTTGRSVFVTVDGRGHIVSRTSSDLTVHGYGNTKHIVYRNLQPLARFTWNPADQGTWGTCSGACCAKN
jgi:hypothetical protein